MRRNFTTYLWLLILTLAGVSLVSVPIRAEESAAEEVNALTDEITARQARLDELADRNELYENPLHPYTKALLSAVPVPDPAVEKTRERIILTGAVPSPLRPPPGCVFPTRCPIAIDECRQVIPEWRDVGGGHMVACHRVGES